MISRIMLKKFHCLVRTRGKPQIGSDRLGFILSTCTQTRWLRRSQGTPSMCTRWWLGWVGLLGFLCREFKGTWQSCIVLLYSAFWVSALFRFGTQLCRQITFSTMFFFVIIPATPIFFRDTSFSPANLPHKKTFSLAF